MTILKSFEGRLKPIGLLVVGVYLLAGCIPVPSTQQYMTNGQSKPSYAIGRDANAKIRLGVTPIDDAVQVVCERVAGVQSDRSLLNDHAVSYTAEQVRRMVVVTNGGRRHVIVYSRRSGYTVWPLCFQAWPMNERDYIALDSDERGTIVDYHTSHDPKVLGVTSGQFNRTPPISNDARDITSRPAEATQ